MIQWFKFLKKFIFPISFVLEYQISELPICTKRFISSLCKEMIIFYSQSLWNWAFYSLEYFKCDRWDDEIKCSFSFKNLANALHATNNLQIIPDFSLKDSRDQTVLGLALWTGKVVPEAVDICRQT